MSYILIIVSFLLFTFISVVTCKKGVESGKLKYSLIFTFSIVLAGIFAVVGICKTASLVKTYSELDANIAACKQNYEIIVYQLENNLYQDNNIGLKDLMDSVESWNSDLARGKELQDNFWVGIYYPDIYDQFELIDLSDYELEVEQCQE